MRTWWWPTLRNIKSLLRAWVTVIQQVYHLGQNNLDMVELREFKMVSSWWCHWKNGIQVAIQTRYGKILQGKDKTKRNNLKDWHCLCLSIIVCDEPSFIPILPPFFSSASVTYLSFFQSHLPFSPTFPHYQETKSCKPDSLQMSHDVHWWLISKNELHMLQSMLFCQILWCTDL